MLFNISKMKIIKMKERNTIKDNWYRYCNSRCSGLFCHKTIKIKILTMLTYIL